MNDESTEKKHKEHRKHKELPEKIFVFFAFLVVKRPFSVGSMIIGERDYKKGRNGLFFLVRCIGLDGPVYRGRL